MSKPIYTETEACRLMNTCGKGFLAYWLEPAIENFNMLSSNIDGAKDTFVEECHESGLGFDPSSIPATRVRVNNALRLIEWGYARFALEYIASSNRLDANATARAKATLGHLDSGELNLPFRRKA